MSATKRVDAYRLCTCGGRLLAVMVPIFAYGVQGGSADIERYECDTCGRGWDA